MKDFYELFIHELKDAYDCERQILKALPKMIEAASSHKLKEALRHHLGESEGHLQRLVEISHDLNEKLTKAKCDGIRGILNECQKIANADYQKDVKDAAIIAACQRVEHYEIAVYGVLKTYAKHLNLKDAEDLFIATLKEEGNADKKLTEIAEGTLFTSGINIKASKRKVA